MAELNVSKAAEKLFIGQSAMSHSLTACGKHSTTPYLVRTTGGMKPTARQELIEPIRKALLEIEVAITTNQAFEPKTAQQLFVIAASNYNELILEPLAKLPTSIRGKLTQASEKPFFLVGNSIWVPLSANLVVFVKIRAHLSPHAIKSPC